MEQLSNSVASGLLNPILSGDTSIIVMDASHFPNPASGHYRLLCDSELMLVTGLTSNTLTVTRGIEGTTAAVHGANASCTVCLTAGAIAAYVQQVASGDDAGFMSHVSDDTSPGLGGNLALNGHNVGGVTPTQLSYVDATSSIQTQLNAKAATSALSSYALLAGATFSGSISAANLSGTNTGDENLAPYALISSLGSAAGLDVGTGANDVVQLNGSAKLPAVDGSLLTGVTAAPSPAGATTQLQYNLGGTLTADAGLTWTGGAGGTFAVVSTTSRKIVLSGASANQSIYFTNAGGHDLEIYSDASGFHLFDSGGGVAIADMNASTASFHGALSAANLSGTNTGDQDATIDYTPGDISRWQGTSPVTVAVALDRIAFALNTLLTPP